MFKIVLLPIDGSPLAARAVPFARRIVMAAGARLVVVRAYLPPDDDDVSLRITYPNKSRTERAQIDLKKAQAEFQSQVDRLRESGCEVEPRFVHGAAADVIFETARELRANLLVMSTHGRGGLGRWLYGSVADEVLRRVPVPVLLIPATCIRRWNDAQLARVLVPLDGSSLAAEVIQPASTLAENLGNAEIELLAVVERPVRIYAEAEVQEASDPVRERAQAMEYLEAVASQLARSAPGSVRARVEYGEVALTIAAVARQSEASAIAIATHARGGLARLALGSVATRTLQLSSVPVFVYRPVTLGETVLDRAVDKVLQVST